jgi:hypothetical protein
VTVSLEIDITRKGTATFLLRNVHTTTSLFARERQIHPARAHREHED